MISTSTPSTHRASFAIGDEQTARRVVDLLTESFFEGQAAIAAFEGPGGRWDITVHFAQAPDETSIRELVAIAAGGEVAQDISFDIVEAKDWVKATLEELVPVHAGRFIVHGRHDHAKVPPNKLGIAIAAAKALHGAVLASDIDPASVQVSRDNARLNEVGNLVQTIRASGFSAPPFKAHGRFDLVLANILANPLRQLATPMTRHLAPSASVILSGLLPHQAGGVIAAYRARGLVLVRHVRIEGWSSLLMRKAR